MTRLALVDAAGTVLLHLGRAEWCADGGEPDLAAALGLAWDPRPVAPLDTVAQPSVSLRGRACSTRSAAGARPLALWVSCGPSATTIP